MMGQMQCILVQTYPSPFSFAYDERRIERDRFPREPGAEEGCGEVRLSSAGTLCRAVSGEERKPQLPQLECLMHKHVITHRSLGVT